MNYKPILLFLIAALLGALGQYFYKTGAQSNEGNLFSYLTNYRIIIGILCYITIMFLFIIAFRIGALLTVVYPVYATTFIWGMLIGVFILGEKINISNIAGIIFIILGVYLIAK